MRFSQFAGNESDTLLADILKYASDPRIISLAGGVPDPRALPDLEFSGGQQYGNARGIMKIIEWAGKRYGIGKQGIVTNGSQEAIFILSSLLIDKGDPVLVEEDTYMAAAKVFRRFGAKLVPVRTDNNGIIPEDLESKAPGAKMLYTIPDFSNPSGILMSGERRKEISEIIDSNDIVCIEDTAYRELWYDSKPGRPISSLSSNAVFVGSFSKTVAPGLRVGYMIGPDEIIEKAAEIKTEINLHTSETSQMMIVNFLRKFDKHVNSLRKLYMKKRDVMKDSLEDKGIDAASPEGGFFFYIETGKDTTTMLRDAVRAGVAYVPGEFFRPDRKRTLLRLSFSQPTEEEIKEGINRLASVLK